MEGIKYIVKPEDGVVVGIYDTDIYREAELLRCRIDVPDFMMYHGLLEESLREILTNNYGKDIEIKAIARCSHGDVFDAEYGKKLVAARIDYKYHKMMERVARYIAKKLQKARRCMLEGEMLHQSKMDAIEDDLKGYFMVKV